MEISYITQERYLVNKKKLQTKLINVTNGNKKIRELLSKYKTHNSKVKDDLIFDLIEFHPTKKLKKENIEKLMIKVRPPFNKLALHYKSYDEDKEDDISWKLCIRNLFDKYSEEKTNIEDVKGAFRNEIHHGKNKKYYMENTYELEDNIRIGKCKNCEKETSILEVDHYPISYSEIFDNFILCNELDLKTIQIYENMNNELCISDTILKKKWLDYHDKKVKYRLLCQNCNRSFGSYGYVSQL